MCRRLHTYFFYSEKKLYTNNAEDSLSNANQVIYEQLTEINGLKSTVQMLEKTVREEQEAKYKAWKRLAELTQLGSI